MNRITTAGNTVVPTILALERAGFQVRMETEGGHKMCSATRAGDVYVAEDPVTVLGLVKLVESRGWNWKPSDEEIESTLRRYHLE